LRLAATRFEQQRVQADQTLESKKKLIDAKLEEMSGSLQRVNNLLQEVNKQRAESHASLKTELERATQATNRLHDTTAQLREALANPQRRGQWGERMAEDVLRLAGFIEGVNYFKQQSDGAGNRPDFTFPLPDNRKVNMDVKFPLANYLRMLESEDELQRASLRSAFLRDMRSRVKEVTTRDYIDPAGGTVDYVLVFIPNEQIYSFIHEHDATLLDEALRNRVVLCSPLTLYAILAVIRQAAENFRLEQGSRQILQLLGEFKKQWTRYCESMETMGKRLEAAMKEYGELTGVRTRQLDRQLDKIDDLRAATEHEPTEQPTRSLP
jgi:DNA recombination protein RmuC